jgi:glycosyltransferase involved in cell wall biosynthesis
MSESPRPVAGSSFAVVANGYADGPAQALRDYLVGRGARVVMVTHPLLPEHGKRHVVTTFENRHEVRVRTRWTPLRPPASYAVDPLVPLVIPRVDAWFGFNPLAAARGLLQRRLRRATAVVLWSVDFTPDRFGEGALLTRLYDRCDRLACRHADARVELSARARDARDARLGLDGATPVHFVPMGAWLARTPVVSADGFDARRIVFLGHLTEGRGTEVLLDALALLRSRGSQLDLDVIGDGDQLPALRRQAARLGLGEAVRFHGYVADHREVERLLAEGSVAAAPYLATESTFTRWADPGKLKAYLAAGLPIVLTDVPPNAQELSREAGAEIVRQTPDELAAGLERVLASPEAWRERRARALAYVRRFDWPQLFSELFVELGFRA